MKVGLPLIAMLAVCACSDPLPLKLPEPEGAESVVIGLRNADGEVVFRAEPLPVAAAFSDRFDGAEGVLLYFSKSPGALRLPTGPLVLDEDGIELEALGDEWEVTPEIFTRALAAGDFRAADSLPEWASEVSVTPRDLSRLCPTITVGSALPIRGGQNFRTFVPLPDGSLLVPDFAPDSRLYLVQPDGLNVPEVTAVGTIPLRVYGGQVVGNHVVLTGLDSITSSAAVALLPVSSVLAGDATDGVEIENIEETSPVRAVFPGSGGLDGMRVVTRAADVFERDSGGQWARTLDGDFLEPPEGCTQAVPGGVGRYAEIWEDSDASYVAFNFGSATFNRIHILRFNASGVSGECLEPSLVVEDLGMVSVKITGVHEDGFVAFRQLERFRIKRTPQRWETRERLFTDGGPKFLLPFDLGADSPPAYLYGSSSGQLGITFLGGPSCESVNFATDQVEWIWPLGEGGFLASPMMGLPRVVTID